MGLGAAQVKTRFDGSQTDGKAPDGKAPDGKAPDGKDMVSPSPQSTGQKSASRMSTSQNLVRRMAVERLLLTNFRSYAQAEIRAGAQPVVLTGANGAGKTNLLEALSFLMPGRGLRAARLTDVTRMNASAGGSAGANASGVNGWAVAATLQGLEGEVSIGTGITGLDAGTADAAEDAGIERRVVRIDGETQGSAAVLGRHVRMVWLTPQMDGLFLDGASVRRRFLDRLTVAFHIGHGQQLNGYERAMRERNRLLAEGRMDPAWLKALESQMAEFGTAVAAARQDTVLQLQAALDMTEGAFPRARLALKGMLEEALEDEPAVEVEDRFKAELGALRRVDAAAGRATIGPHRTDLEAHHAPREMPAALCSTGEQKALLLGITLASARMIAAQTGLAPIVLLDEVAAHLDGNRRAALFDEICALQAQVWLTGADKGLFGGLEGKAMFFSVVNGAILGPGS
jgi:DNA replication and repair protein RecF